ncbi:substrate-binding periplasmic protein [Pseudoalteromonas sp. SSMSWG5]|uniref:substrate-binding periplasmic protein n=1 Tax=unclassified Pseudoalteromonas TaxID=194690 RepID=UPI0010935823|nr:transporter substrate-binding domain-containing protein [Pseudoalteromonas sp. MEBiC 03607]TGV17341.1 transporter substrate-binding domain-containing protein [Pseudoalteromonas sp. MEBiC 03607]
MAKQTITIYTEQFPPYNFSNKGHLEGINLEFVRAMCVDAEIECQFELLPWPRAYHLAQKKPLSGLVSTARITDREALFNWIGPLASSKNFFYRLKSNEHINPRDLAQVKEYSVCTVRESIYENFLESLGFKADKNLLKVSHYYECINLFLKNKVELIVGSELSFRYLLMQYGHYGQEVVKLVELPLERTQGNFLALNKDIPDEILSKLQTSYDRLIQRGLLEKYIADYFVPIE